MIRLGQLGKRYYNLYSPVTLSTMTIGGSVPCNNLKRNIFALRIESSSNLLMLDIPETKKDASYKPRAKFWDSLKWTRDISFKKF